MALGAIPKVDRVVRPAIFAGKATQNKTLRMSRTSDSARPMD
jgi:hypothetical protein